MTLKTKRSTKSRSCQADPEQLTERVTNFPLQDRIHILLGSLAALFLLALGSINCQLQMVFIGLAIFEFAMTSLYITENLYVMMVHMLYQSMAFGAPCALLAMTIFHSINPQGASDSLDSFNFVLIKDLVQRNYIGWTSLLLILWASRIFLTHKYMVDTNTRARIKMERNYDLGNIKQSSVHCFLNSSAVILFSMLSYFCSGSLQCVFLALAAIETLIAFSYILMNQWPILVHLVFQAILFSVPIFLNFTTVVHIFCPKFATNVLLSYGLTETSAFISKNPLFVTSLLCTTWSIRLITTHAFLLEVATDSRVARRQRLRHSPLV